SKKEKPKERRSEGRGSPDKNKEKASEGSLKKKGKAKEQQLGSENSPSKKKKRAKEQLSGGASTGNREKYQPETEGSKRQEEKKPWKGKERAIDYLSDGSRPPLPVFNSLKPFWLKNDSNWGRTKDPFSWSDNESGSDGNYRGKNNESEVASHGESGRSDNENGGGNDGSINSSVGESGSHRDSGDEGEDSGDEGGDSGDEGGDSGDEGGDSGDEGGDSGDEGGGSGDEGRDSGDDGGDSGDEGVDSGDEGGGPGSAGGGFGDDDSDENSDVNGLASIRRATEDAFGTSLRRGKVAYWRGQGSGYAVLVEYGRGSNKMGRVEPSGGRVFPKVKENHIDTTSRGNIRSGPIHVPVTPRNAGRRGSRKYTEGGIKDYGLVYYRVDDEWKHNPVGPLQPAAGAWYPETYISLQWNDDVWTCEPRYCFRLIFDGTSLEADRLLYTLARIQYQKYEGARTGIVPSLPLNPTSNPHWRNTQANGGAHYRVPRAIPRLPEEDEEVEETPTKSDEEFVASDTDEYVSEAESIPPSPERRRHRRTPKRRARSVEE
ncbi:hypothetical protein AJ80_10082, partial [Polytolypa hystricis UAMH7299]